MVAGRTQQQPLLQQSLRLTLWLPQMQERSVFGKGTPKRGHSREGAKGPFTKGLRSYIQECPWQGQGRARAVLSNHDDGPWAPS